MPLAPAAVKGGIARFDEGVEEVVESLRGHPAVDRVFYAASALADFSLVWLWLGAARGLRGSGRDERAALRLGVGVLVESIAVNWGVKSLFRRTRPPWETPRAHRIRRPLTSSFPSGHATSAFCSAILLAEDDPLWPLYYLAAAVVATSRLYVKIHHASDVVAGAALGVGMGLLGRRVMPLDKGGLALSRPW